MWSYDWDSEISLLRLFSPHFRDHSISLIPCNCISWSFPVLEPTTTTTGNLLWLPNFYLTSNVLHSFTLFLCFALFHCLQIELSSDFCICVDTLWYLIEDKNIYKSVKFLSTKINLPLKTYIGNEMEFICMTWLICPILGWYVGNKTEVLP